VRTTLTLDDDVASLLAKEVRRSGVSFKTAVNQFLRLGLIRSGQPAARPFLVAPRSLGLPPGASYDNIAELLEEIEGGSHK
jgi:hypothetical protein